MIFIGNYKELQDPSEVVDVNLFAFRLAYLGVKEKSKGQHWTLEEAWSMSARRLIKGGSEKWLCHEKF